MNAGSISLFEESQKNSISIFLSKCEGGFFIWQQSSESFLNQLFILILEIIAQWKIRSKLTPLRQLKMTPSARAN